MVPAFLLLAALALAAHASVGPEASSAGERTAVVDDAVCRCVSAGLESDPLSSGFVGIMVRFTAALDRVSRDATVLLAWVEEVLTHDGVEGLDVLVDGVSGWLAGTFELPRCADPA